jgi:endonuclease YncB( thermonuclease family)
MRPVIASIMLIIFLAPSAPGASKPWQVLEDCNLVQSSINDGDSFRTHWNGGELTVRLYFADTPEADYRFMDRTKAQAAYFSITEE